MLLLQQQGARELLLLLEDRWAGTLRALTREELRPGQTRDGIAAA